MQELMTRCSVIITDRDFYKSKMMVDLQCMNYDEFYVVYYRHHLHSGYGFDNFS